MNKILKVFLFLNLLVISCAPNVKTLQTSAPNLYDTSLKKYAEYSGLIDGSDIIIFQRDSYRIEHIDWKQPKNNHCEFFSIPPETQIKMFLHPIQGNKDKMSFVELPRLENGFSTKVLLDDNAHPFASQMSFALYYKVLENEFSSNPVFPQQQNTKVKINDSISTQWAIIVGISKYQHSGQSGLTNLIFADDDARAFARSLRNLGWNESHMRLLINKEATQRNIMIALESWLSKAGSNDQIVLFWAGHGFSDPEDPEKVYFACYDTDISIPATGYRMDQVRRALEERKAKNVVLLADTCHAGKLITRGDGSRGISIVPNIKKQNTPKGWIFMVGADTDRQAIEHISWSNGAFTHTLLKGLNGEADGFQSAGAKDGIVTLGELKDYMNTVMPDETQKVLGVAKRPVIATSTGDPDIWNLTLQVKQ